MLAHSDGALPIWAATLELRQLEVLIELGDGLAIARWVLAHWTPPDPTAPVTLILHQLGLALALANNHTLPDLQTQLRGRIQESLPQCTEALLHACLTRFRAWGLGAVVLELQTLAAVLSAARGDTQASELALAEALRLAASEGFVRPFISRGERMRQLLATGLPHWKKNAAWQPLVACIERVLAAFLAQHTAAGSASVSHRTESVPLQPAVLPPTLPEHLSHREREVLPLLAAGLSHREIATALTIAPNTARTHIKNIYSKLQVRNRVEALDQARAYGLL
jgi:LuxR family maltose regulon positive regulatory protein